MPGDQAPNSPPKLGGVPKGRECVNRLGARCHKSTELSLKMTQISGYDTRNNRRHHQRLHLLRPVHRPQGERHPRILQHLDGGIKPDRGYHTPQATTHPPAPSGCQTIAVGISPRLDMFPYPSPFHLLSFAWWVVSLFRQGFSYGVPLVLLQFPPPIG